MRRRLLAFAMAGALLAACGGSDTATGATDPSTVAPTADAAPSSPPDTFEAAGEPEVPEALDFSAPLVDGSVLDFRGFAGDTVALWFWAPT